MKPTILIFIDWYLPGYKAGGPVRSIANLIDHLGSDFYFKVITRNNDYKDDKPYAGIVAGKWNELSENAECCYLSPQQTNYSFIKQIIRNTDFDLFYINGIYSLRFSILPLILAKKFQDKKIIVAPRGMLAGSAIGVKKLKKIFFLSLAKLLNIYKNVKFHATNEKEVFDIKKYINKNSSVQIAPNLPKKVTSGKYLHKKKSEKKLQLVSVARISPEKNTLFALTLLDHNYSGEIIFDIYGSVYNNTYWLQCKTLIKQLPSNIVVNYKGSIEPDKMEQIYQNCDFLFLPTRGENFGHSILESMSVGTPVIISDQTPWRNLEKKWTGWDINLSDIDKFQKVIQKCTDMNNTEYSVFSLNSFKFAESYCNSEELIERSKKIFLI